MMQLSAEARNLNWLVSNFVAGVPGVKRSHRRVVGRPAHRAVRRSRPQSRSTGSRRSPPGCSASPRVRSTPIGGGRVHEVIVEMDVAMLFVMRVSDTSVLASTTARPCDVGLVGYEMAVLVERCASALDARRSSPSSRPRSRRSAIR